MAEVPYVLFLATVLGTLTLIVYGIVGLFDFSAE